MKSDPCKPYLFRSKEDFKIELEVTVRNAQDGSGYATRGGRSTGEQRAGQFSVGVGPRSSNDSDEDDRDDEVAYAAYQSDAQYAGYDGADGAIEENLVGLLNLQPQQDERGR